MKRDLEHQEGEPESNHAPVKEEDVSASESEDDVGPSLPAAPTDDPPSKKRRRLVLNAKKFYDDLPQLERYARSFMHRDTVASVRVAQQTHFLITASIDGFVKFWKKMPTGIEFVKQYRAHVGVVTATSTNVDGTLYASACASERTIKAFDVVNFDLFTMLQLDYTPRAICWVHRRGQAQALLAVSDADSADVRIYDLKGDTEPCYRSNAIHSKSVKVMSYNEKYHCVISCDEIGHVEYWTPDDELKKPESVFQQKSATDLYEFRKSKSVPTCITISPDCESFATFSHPDREIRLFKVKSGKIVRKYDESLATIESMHNAGTSVVQLDDIEYGKRLAVERELERTPGAMDDINVVFDESGLFIMYATLLGVKVVNTNSNACVKVYGRDEKVRITQLALYQGAPKKGKTTTLAMAASDNPLLSESAKRDPILFCTAYKRPRFYLFTSHELGDSKLDRDALNEKPEAGADDGAGAAASGVADRAAATSATMHTSAGDIQLRLYPDKTPLAVENFVRLAREGYYDGTLFHRVIRQFMIQGGDPLGTGTGGASIWGEPFADEFHADLSHEAYALAMANSGPASNGSQFFITTAEARHLDGKHTVFGRVAGGWEVVHAIERAPVGKLDRPREPARIHSIELA